MTTSTIFVFSHQKMVINNTRSCIHGLTENSSDWSWSTSKKNEWKLTPVNTFLWNVRKGLMSYFDIVCHPTASTSSGLKATGRHELNCPFSSRVWEKKWWFDGTEGYKDPVKMAAVLDFFEAFRKRQEVRGKKHKWFWRRPMKAERGLQREILDQSKWEKIVS